MAVKSAVSRLPHKPSALFLIIGLRKLCHGFFHGTVMRHAALSMVNLDEEIFYWCMLTIHRCLFMSGIMSRKAHGTSATLLRNSRYSTMECTQKLYQADRICNYVQATSRRTTRLQRQAMESNAERIHSNRSTTVLLRFQHWSAFVYGSQGSVMG